MSDSSVVSPSSRADRVTVTGLREVLDGWIERAGHAPSDSAVRRLVRATADPAATEFLARIAHGVLRPADPSAAAHELERLVRDIPPGLSRAERVPVTAAGGFSVLLPRPLVPVVRAGVGRYLRPFLLDDDLGRLEGTLERRRRPGLRLEVRPLLGPAVGDREAAGRVAAIRDALVRGPVDHLAVPLSAVAGPQSAWGFDTAIERATAHLGPLLETAAARRTTFTVESHGRADLDLVLALVTRLLAAPALAAVEGGASLTADAPDAVDALRELIAWARARVAGGGAGLRLRIAAVPTESPATDAVFARMLDTALTPSATDAVRVVVASSDPGHLALASSIAAVRGVTSRLELETALGDPAGWVDALGSGAGAVVVAAALPFGDRSATARFLARRIREFARIAHPEAVDDARLSRLLDALAHPDDARPRSPGGVVRDPGAAGRPEDDTDPALAANREWGRAILGRVADSEVGLATVRSATARDADRLRELLVRTGVAASSWGRQSADVRAGAIRRAGEIAGFHRERLIEAMLAEDLVPFVVADREASSIAGLARVSADRALETHSEDGTVVTAVALTLVLPSQSLAATAADVIAALAAGGAVVLVLDPAASRSLAVLAEVLWEAGIPREVLAVVHAAPADLATALSAPSGASRLAVAGTPGARRWLREALPQLEAVDRVPAAATVVVAPSADLDSTIGHLVHGAFVGTPTAARTTLAIVVGRLADDEVFRARLADAAASLLVGPTTDIATQVGALPAVPDGDLELLLTQPGPEEDWLTRTRALDASRRLWSPGIRDGVRPDSEIVRAGMPAPVLGLVRAASLDEAIELQRTLSSGGAAGLFALDPGEIARWIEATDAPVLVVNRPVPSPRPGRRPWGGSRRSPGLVGGPNALVPYLTWSAAEVAPDGDLRLDGLDEAVRSLIEACQPALDYEEFDRVRRSALSDERAWAAEFGTTRELFRSSSERDVVRYLPAEILVRRSAEGTLDDLVSVLASGIRAGATMRVSSAEPLPSGLLRLAADRALGILSADLESDAEWFDRVRREAPARIRIVGSGAALSPEFRDLARDARIAVWSGPVTRVGRVELLPFLREQSVSISVGPDHTLPALLLDL